MSLILCLETTSTNCSVALARENSGFANLYGIINCLDLIEDQSDHHSHGERLHIFIKELLDRNKVTVKDLDAVAISEGPGSYTGLRIGVASAKGLCYALDIPLIAVSTLKSLSLQNRQPGITIPMVDARRMEVYTAVFKDQQLEEDVAATVLDDGSFSRFRKSGIVTFIGTGTEKFKNLINEPQHHYINTPPTALTMCDLAIDKYKKSDTVSVAYFEPFYLKEFKAG
jgi:tRNA threonylcarbamoyladenosine biosynthesis protein TsaB